MSPSDQPVEIRLTLSREEAVAFLERLASGELRADWQESPEDVLRTNGIEVSPPEAIPREYPDLTPEDVESAVRHLRPPQPDVPYNGQWPFFPFVGLLAKPEEGGGSETT